MTTRARANVAPETGAQPPPIPRWARLWLAVAQFAIERLQHCAVPLYVQAVTYGPHKVPGIGTAPKTGSIAVGYGARPFSHPSRRLIHVGMSRQQFDGMIEGAQETAQIQDRQYANYWGPNPDERLQYTAAGRWELPEGVGP